MFSTLFAVVLGLVLVRGAVCRNQWLPQSVPEATGGDRRNGTNAECASRKISLHFTIIAVLEIDVHYLNATTGSPKLPKDGGSWAR